MAAKSDTPRYSKYKDSGIEWIGEVPEHWGVTKIKYCGNEVKSKNTGMIETNLLSLSYGSVIKKSIDTTEGLLPENFESYNIINEGTIVFRLTDLQNDKKSLRSAIATEKGIITSAYCSVGFTGDSLPQYINYLMRSYDLQKVFYNLGSGVRQNLKYSELSGMAIPLPPLPEQKAIAAYLDEKTSETDALIQEQEKLIELLQEKRSSLISEAVTRGLDTRVKTKDSGIEWIGEVPEHWAVSRIGSLFNRRSTKVSDKDYAALSVTNRGILPQLETVAKTDNNDDRKLVMAGDFAINSRSDRRGSAGVSSLDGSVSNITIVLEFRQRSNKEFYNYLLTCYPFQEEFYKYGTGIVDDLWTTNYERMKQISLPTPPLDEQKKIASYLDTETAKIDSLIAESENLISLLQERRSSLISEVVTGKRRIVA